MWTRQEFLKLSEGARPVSSSFAWKAHPKAHPQPEGGTPTTCPGYFRKGGEGRR